MLPGEAIWREAANLVCDFAINTPVNCNVRIEGKPLSAGHNELSKNLLRRLGFEQEGYAKSYLQINGSWQDHLLWGRTEG